MALPDRFRRLGRRLGLEREWALVGLAVVIGVGMSFVARAFLWPLHWVEEHAAGFADDTTLLWVIVVAVPIAGALLCGLVQWIIPAGEGDGPGVSKVMYAIHRRQGRLPWSMGVRKWLASTMTIGSGGSAGAEGPIVTIGAVLGSGAGRLLNASPQGTATLLGCGAAAGISSVFNAPIAGVFFVMEILLRDFSLRTFTPIVVASVVAAAVTQSALGSAPLFPGGRELDISQAFSWHEIPNYFILGIICGVVAALFVRALYGTMSFFDRSPLPRVVRPAAGAVVLVCLGVISMLILPQLPAFYGNGYAEVARFLSESPYMDNGMLGATVPVLGGLIALAIIKGIATCLTIGSGGAGGMFAPSLFIGAATGGAFGFVVNAIDLAPAASPAYYALVGMAAVVAASTHAPLTAILIVYEITQRYEVILPIMFAAVISTIVGRLMGRDSVYTVRLASLGVRIGAMSDHTLLRRMVAGDVPLVAPVFVHPEDRADQLLGLSEKLGVRDFVVTDQRNQYLGMVTGGDLRETLVYREAIPLLSVHELQRTDLPTVTPAETLDSVLAKFSAHDVDALTVLDDDSDGVLGLITRTRLMRSYRHALDEES